MVDVMPTLLALAGARGSSDRPFDGKDIWPTLAEGKPSPHEDILINVESFRGAIRKGDWKLVKIALLPGKVGAVRPGQGSRREKQRGRAAPGHRAAIWKPACWRYAARQEPSEWIKAQPAFLGAQGQTVFDPDFDIDDGGLPREKPVDAGRGQPRPAVNPARIQ